MNSCSFQNFVHLVRLQRTSSSGSSGLVGVGEGTGKKHETYVAAFGGHLFYDLFLKDRGDAMDPLAHPWIRY